MSDTINITVTAGALVVDGRVLPHGNYTLDSVEGLRLISACAGAIEAGQVVVGPVELAAVPDVVLMTERDVKDCIANGDWTREQLVAILDAEATEKNRSGIVRRLKSAIAANEQAALGPVTVEAG